MRYRVQSKKRENSGGIPKRQEPETIRNDGSRYAIIREFRLDGCRYYLFANDRTPKPTDPTRIFFRKDLEKDGVEYYAGLDGVAELERVMNHFRHEIAEAVEKWRARSADGPF